MSEHGNLVIGQGPFGAIRIVSQGVVFRLEDFFVGRIIVCFLLCAEELSGSWGLKNAGMKSIKVFLNHYELAKPIPQRRGGTNLCYSGNFQRRRNENARHRDQCTHDLRRSRRVVGAPAGLPLPYLIFFNP